MVEAALQSDLRCFYDADCLQRLSNNLGLSNINISSIILMNSTLENSRFRPEAQLLDIVSNLMVESWNNQISYKNYFDKCRPSMCTANYIGRGSIIYSVTAIIGLIGGLTKAYKFAVPLIVKLTSQYVVPFIKRKYTVRRNHSVSAQNVC